jgi:hypothetical protein
LILIPDTSLAGSQKRKRMSNAEISDYKLAEKVVETFERPKASQLNLPLHCNLPGNF